MLPKCELFVSRLGLAMALIGLASACALRSDNGDGAAGRTLGSQAVLSGQATLACSQQCAGRAQCGASPQGEMVLLSTLGPVTRNHDWAVPSGTQVTISQSQPQTVIQAADGQPLSIVYYLVEVPGRGLAWAAGWCVGQ
ncbi:MAG: hypothetical protein ACRDHL_11415 [Candidatus Promineifilaceae bacterium]